MNIFPKFHECGSKIEPATPISTLNFEWAWQVQILMYTHKTLGNYLSFIDEQMILLPFLYISNQNLANLEKTIFSLYPRPLSVENPSNSTVSGLELREKIGFSKFSHFWLEI